MVVPMSLDRVASEAARIVHGTVSDVRTARDEHGLPATWVTLDVARTLKGPGSAHVVFKQIGVIDPLPDGTIARVPGLPRYAVGDEVVVFLRGESGRGFTSPVGLGQGLYRVERRGGHAAVHEDPPGRSRRDLDSFLDDVAHLVAP
jgi:hypothetical protein